MWMKGRVLAVIAIIGVLPLFYNNCSPSHDNSEGAGSQSKNGCSDMSELFSRTYHPFVKQHCATCHVPGGLGKGTFADSNLTVAWRSFEVTGFSKVSEYAVNPSHQSPYTGPQHEAEVSQLRETWVKGIEEAERNCKDGVPIDETEDKGPRIRTKSKGINANFATGQAVTLTWGLDRELIADDGITLPTLPGALFEVKVSVQDVLGIKSYLISEPRIRGSSVDIAVKSIRFTVNGKSLSGNLTFNAVNEAIRAGTNVLLSAGTNVAPIKVSYSDVIAVSFGSLEIPSEPIPPPSAGPQVAFSVAASSVVESAGLATVRVNLSQPSAKYVTVTIRVNGQTTSSALCCIDNFTNEEQESISINRFDWDYKVKTYSVVIPPGETFKNFEIDIANDQRDEGASETLVLDLDSIGTVNAVLGSVTRHTLTLQDDDDPYAGAALTMTQLLRPGGILYVNCLGCHNSVDNEGGYDITDWQSLIDNRILIPYDVNSKAFVRMNSKLAGLPPMPFTGLLETEKRRAVQDWIMAGAQNN